MEITEELYLSVVDRISRAGALCQVMYDAETQEYKEVWTAKDGNELLCYSVNDRYYLISMPLEEELPPNEEHIIYTIPLSEYTELMRSVTEEKE